MRSLAATQIRSDINVTPLVDVVLVLLIIFMVITPLLQVGYDVTVPKSERDPVAQPEDQIVVALKSDGSVSLNREAIAKNLLAARLVSILSARSSKTVFFSGDDEVQYGRAIEVMDAIRAAGATHIGIAPSPLELLPNR